MKNPEIYQRFIVAIIIIVVCWAILRDTNPKIAYVDPPPSEEYITNRIASVCIDGIKYYIINGWREHSLTPAFNQDGSLKICKKEQPPEKEMNNDNDHP